MVDAVTAAVRTGDWRHVVARADAEPDQVVAAVLSSGVRWNALPGEVAAVLSVAHQLRSADPHERDLLLELARARHGVPPHGEACAGFRLRWADVPPRPTHVTVATGCDDWLTATVPLPGGGALLAYQAQRRALHLWDPATGTVTATIRGRGTVSAVAAGIGPDGVPRLAVASGRSVRVCDPRTGAVLDTWMAGVDKAVTAACWATLPDGRLALATGDKDGAVLVWTPTGTQLAEVTRGGRGTPARSPRSCRGRSPTVACCSRSPGSARRGCRWSSCPVPGSATSTACRRPARSRSAIGCCWPPRGSRRSRCGRRASGSGSASRSG
ncbi:hypothetical protein Asera_32800 [Actinocatenispora sera]|uniref:WD40 repeat protein n=2 Tax=Actinocatenispora sera TaxID=390989 RepID=A0A810L3G9_9ACTN|nr:hypothetical protein Asera_32800 [Actinocatenispora sera]